MAEPLLAANSNAGGPSCSNEDYYDQRCTTRWSKQSLSTDSLTFFLHFRPKFIFAGFLFGALMELAYLQTVRRLGGISNMEPTSAAADTDSVRMDPWTYVFHYNLCLLYSDVMFVLYMVILTHYALKTKTNLSLSKIITATNWTVGMVLGSLVAVASLIGLKVMVEQRIWQVLVLSMVVAIALCIVTYSTAMEMLVHQM